MEVSCHRTPSRRLYRSHNELILYHDVFRKLLRTGFLTDHFPKATKACWDIDGIYCTSRHIPGVKFPGLIHPGLIGTAPR